MGGTPKINRNPAPSPEVAQQLESQRRISEQLAAQQTVFQQQYQAQLAQTQEAYNRQYGLLTQQAAEQKKQQEEVAARLAEQLRIQEEEKKKQQEYYDAMLVSAQEQSKANQSATERAIDARNTTASNTANSLLLSNEATGARQGYRQQVTRARGASSVGGSGDASLLRR
jgi:hypothetical protein